MALFKYTTVFLIAALSTNIVTSFIQEENDPDDLGRHYLLDNINEIRDKIIANASDFSILTQAHTVACRLERVARIEPMPSPPIDENMVTNKIDLESINQLMGELIDIYDTTADSLAMARKAREITTKIASQLTKKIASKSSKENSKSKSSKENTKSSKENSKSSSNSKPIKKKK